MSAVTIQQMADRIAGLLEDRLGVPGKGLSEKLRRQPRALPRNVRAEARILARAADQSAHPRLLMQIDEDRVARAFDICLRHLQRIDAGTRRRSLVLGIAGSIAFGLFVVAALAVAVLLWRGLI
jgi:hypothetical protein